MADATKLGGLTLGAVAATAVASAVVASVATCALLHTATRGYPCRASSREKAGSSGPAGLNWLCRVVTGRQRSSAHMPEGVQLGSACSCDSSGSPSISCCSPRQSSGDEASCMAPGCCTPPRLGSTGRSGGGPRMEGDDTVHFTPQQQQFGTPVALRGTRCAQDTSTATAAGWQQQQQQRQAWPQEQRQQHQHCNTKSCLHVSGLLPLASPMLQPKRDPFDPHPREGYLSWDDYFMALAFLSAERSKDPNKQVGACIVDQNHVIIGIGYNGFPRGCPDGVLPWSKKAHDGDMLGTKYPYVVHAEANALLNKNTASVEGASVYVTMFPCNECAKLLIQAGIREVVYHEAKIQTSCQQSSAGQLSATSVSLSIVAAADDASAAVSTKPHQQQAAADEGAGMVDEARVEPDPCYLASMRLLQLAGIRLRQHRLQRSIVLGCS